jgi:hypothetical protein
MKKLLQSVPKISLPLFFILFSLKGFAQQNIISDVDNTHPEFDRFMSRKAFITNFCILEGNNYNEIYWTADEESEVRKYIIEFSSNGYDFQSAGEVVAANKPYVLKHYFNFDHPVMYRIRTEQLNGKYFYSDVQTVAAFAGTRAVEIYPTIIKGNTINVNAALPIEKITVVSNSGTQVYMKNIGGQRDLITLVLPQLSPGMYYMVMAGRNWRATEKFIVQQ